MTIQQQEMSRKAILLLTTAWLSFSTVSSSWRPGDAGLPFTTDCYDRVVKGCACTVENRSSGAALATVNCEDANLTEIPDLRRVGYPVDLL